MRRLANRGHNMDVKILDREVSTDFKKTIVEDWCATYQLVPPNFHRRNLAERAICTFKAHFLVVLAGVYPNFPKFIWDNLLVQTELAINLLQQATLNPRMSAWEYFNGAFDYTATQLGPIGCNTMIKTSSNNRKSWDQRGREGFSVGPALQHYRFIQAIDRKTKKLIIIDTAEYLHQYLTQTHITAEYRMTHAIHFLYAALKDVPTSTCDLKLAAIEAVRTIFANWRTLEYLPPKNPTVLTQSTPIIPRQAVAPVSYPTLTSKVGQEQHTAITSKGSVQQKVITILKNTQVTINSKGDQEPIAKRTRSRIDAEKSPTIQAIQTLNEPITKRTRYHTVTKKYTDPSHSRALATQLLTHVAN